MRKKILALSLVICMGIMSAGCSADETKTNEAESTVTTTELTSLVDENTSSEVVEYTTEKVADESTEEVTTEEPTTEEPTTEEPTTEAKVYDVYVNGKGYDKGTTLQFKISLKANDTEFRICCPSFNVVCEDITSSEQLFEFIEVNTEDCNPLLVCNQGDANVDNGYYAYWEYYQVLELWDNPDGKPLDITDGIYMHTVSVKFNEPGKYNISVTSGNGYEEMAEEFAKYDNCFTFEIIE